MILPSLLPGVRGAVKLAKVADKGLDAASNASHLKRTDIPSNLPDNLGGSGTNKTVKHSSGVSLPKSQDQMIKEFDLASYPTKPLISPTSGKSVGTEYPLPNGSRVRVMQADGRNPKRASFENASRQPIDPTTGKPPQPPSGLTRGERKQYVRERTHIVQDD